MMKKIVFYRAFAWTAFLVGSTHAARAQDVSFSSSVSSSISDPITGSSAESGFNSSFDASTANLSSPSVHADVSDPTHAQLLGSTLSPFDNSYTTSQSQTAPQTGIVSDARSIVGYNEFSLGGSRSLSFSPGSAAQSTDATSSKQNGALVLGSLTMQGAFTGMSGSRAAFSGQAATSSATGRSFSGEGRVAARPQLGLGAQAVEAANGLPDEATAFYASDPVLSGSNGGGETGPEIHGDAPSPNEAAAAFFAVPKTVGFDYQYDDGQTPPLHTSQLPGTIFSGAPEYLPAINGFPDSTKGLAGSAELQANQTPFSKSSLGGDTGASPFASVSDGLAYSPRTHLIPDLHAVTLPKESISFETFERNAQRDRYRLGISISQASDFYQQDLRNYRRSQMHRGPKTSTSDQTVAGQQQELVHNPIIR